MWSYTKSLIAVGLALVALLFASLWAHSRTGVLGTCKSALKSMEEQKAARDGRTVLIGHLEKRLKNVNQDISARTERFAGRDREGTELVEAVVGAAAASGMEMTSAAEVTSLSSIRDPQAMNIPLSVVSYHISLKGTYAGLVRLCQHIDAWKLANSVESLNIRTSIDDETGAELVVDLVLSVFSSAALNVGTVQVTGNQGR